VADLAKYVVSLEAETRKYRRELDRANRKLGQFTKRQERNTARVAASFKRLGLAVAALVSLDQIRRIGSMSDQFNQLAVRIKTATRFTNDFVKVQKELADISVTTGASFESQIDAFQGISRIREGLGASNEQVLAFTRAFSQLGVIGGSSAKQISDSIRQLVQGLAQGTVRMEEFNSISDNTPEVLVAIAKGMDISLDKLILMAKEGKLLATEVFNALLKQSGLISERFQEIPNNLDRAFNAFSTSLGQALSLLDQRVGATQTLADALSEVAIRLSILAGTATPLTRTVTKLDDLREKAAELKEILADNELGFFEGAFGGFQTIDQARAALARYNEEIAVLEASLKKLRGGDPGTVTGKPAPIPVPEISPTVEARFLAPKSDILDPSEVQTTRLDVQLENFAQAIEEQERRASQVQQTFVTLFTDNLVQAAEGGFNSILQSWARTLEQMAARALASQLFKLLGFGNADGGFLGLGKLFSAEGRASGGPVSNGTPFLVGEKGPELFIPGASGRIVPNGEMGGNVFHIDARGAVPGMELRIREAVQEAVAISDSNRIEARRRSR
jgi:tape measure domain-containing protein